MQFKYMFAPSVSMQKCIIADYYTYVISFVCYL